MSKPKHKKRPVNEIAIAIYLLAEWMEKSGNKGVYTQYCPDELQWVLGVRYQPERDGILFYSTGWGWRVRKSPHWRLVANERFKNGQIEEKDPGTASGATPQPDHNY